jgi:hypothetical protein
MSALPQESQARLLSRQTWLVHGCALLPQLAMDGGIVERRVPQGAARARQLGGCHPHEGASDEPQEPGH